MTGLGYWLNPVNQKWVQVTRHELTMRDAAQMQDLGVGPEVLATAQRISPHTRQGEDNLRKLGIRSGLIRVRDHGHRDSYISVQFDAPATAEDELLRFVGEFFSIVNLWRPHVRVGNLRTNSEVTYSWQEFVNRMDQPSIHGN